MTPAQSDALLHDWPFFARPDQLPPPGDWRTWLFLAGRGAGKTRAAAEWIRSKIKSGARNVGLIAPTAAAAREVMVEGSQSGLLAVCWSHDRTVASGHIIGVPSYEPSKRRLTWANGAIATCYSAEEPDRLRGPQHDALWCFTAGTLVATPHGERRIETLRSGDLVLTRDGPKPVIGNSVRRAIVGRVTFSNGSSLVGTAAHPLYLKSGWTRLDRLRVGDAACALAAWCGTKSAGIATARGAAPTTNELTRVSGQSVPFGFIVAFGKIITALWRAGMTCIMSTTISQTTQSAISHACRRASTWRFIAASILSGVLIGQRSLLRPSLALAAARLLPENDPANILAARTAIGAPLTKGADNRAPASNAGQNSTPSVATIAVSVASTWQRVGERFVYCLKVADAPEYFADGLLVHNCDELAAWQKPGSAWDMAMFGLRIGDNPQVVVSTTPRPISIIKELVKSPTCVVTRAQTYDNRANLAGAFLDQIVAKYQGTRLGRQELAGELLEEIEGALWTYAMLDKARLPGTDEPPKLQRVVVAVDPSGCAGKEDERSDEIGIVVVGRDKAGMAYVLQDASGHYSPEQWGTMTIRMFESWGADVIVAEKNFGGAMVESTIRAVRKNVPVRMVTASRGKFQRAEPVAALYEQDKVRHLGTFREMEDQLCSFAANGYMGERSPDRADALIWGLSELMLGHEAPRASMGAY